MSRPASTLSERDSCVNSIEVNRGAYVKAHRDALEREQALVELGLSVTPFVPRV
jgi:hypothetical protein